LKPEETSFSCAQFDRVAERMGVRLREGKRYFFRTGGPLARFDGRDGSVTFDEQRFHSLSARARCSLLAHELEHSRNLEFAMGASTPVVWFVMALAATVYAVVLLMRTDVLSWALAAPVTAVVVLAGVLLGLDLRHRVGWNSELNCDLAAAKLLGRDAVKEWLAIVAEPRWGRFGSHPPNEFRVRSLEEGAAGSAPEIDFDLLERDVPQVIAVDGQPRSARGFATI
jgi:Peptidase family M48